jgi:hypothetical protein
VSYLGQSVYNYPKGIISRLTPRQSYDKIHSNLFPLPLRHLQGLQQSSRSLMLDFDSLASVAKRNILGNVSLHTIPSISGLEIMVHLIPSWMNGISRLVAFWTILTFNSFILGTQIIPLYHNTPWSFFINPGNLPSLVSRFIFLIFPSSSWPFCIS